jgi:hypothetical protein
MINGKTTFAELLDWGISTEAIEGILGKDIPEGIVNIRNFCDQDGLDFSVVKEELQNEADALNQD